MIPEYVAKMDFLMMRGFRKAWIKYIEGRETGPEPGASI